MSDEMMVFSTEDEMREAMYGDDKELARKVTDAVLRDNYKIGKEEEPEEAERDTEEAPVVDLEADPVVDVSIALEEQNKRLKELYEKQVKDKEEELQSQIQERDERLRILEEESKKKSEEVAVDNIQLDEEDPDLASSYSRNTRKLLEAQLEAIQSKITNPEIMTELAELKKKFAEEEEARSNAEKQRKTEENRRKLYDQLDSFSKGKEEYQLPVHVSEAVKEVNDIKDKIGMTFKTDDAAEIEKIYRRVIKENTVWAKTKRDELEKAGVKFPEYSKNYLNIVEVYELQKGRKFNTVAGVYEDAVISLDDAYKLSNFNTLVSKAGSTEAKEIQKKLDQQQNTAVTISNSVTSDAGGEEAYTNEEIAAAIRMNPADLIKNRTLARKYATYLRKEGISVPSVLKNI